MIGKNDEAIYLFCFAFSGSLSEVEGMGTEVGRPLFAKEYGEIAAVLCHVDSNEYTGQDAESRMQDLEWIGPRVVRHQQAVERIMQYSPVFPVPFGTLFHGEDSLKRLIDRHRERISSFLHWGLQAEEWAVKGFVDRSRAKEALLFETLEHKAGEIPRSQGARYLYEKRLLASLDAKLNDRLDAAAKKVFQGLDKMASDSLERRLLSGATDEEMFCNWAFMVPKDAVAAFQKHIERENEKWAESGCRLQCSGPWPPYSFTPALE